MGICTSCEATTVATAKLIHHDGKLQEFTHSVKVSQILQKYPPSYFICNSDEMDFDEFLTAVNADEELQIGQLYFVLPLCRLKRPLQADDLAALAVKASSALMKRSGCGGGGGGGDGRVKSCKCCRNVVFPVSELKSRRDGNIGSGGGGGVIGTEEKKKRRRSMSGGKGRNFLSDLSAIAE